MPLPICMGHDCGRSAWGERIFSLDQFAKESQQPKLRADLRTEAIPAWNHGCPPESPLLKEQLTGSGRGTAPGVRRISPQADAGQDGSDRAFGVFDGSPQVLELLQQQQAALRDLLAGQDGLRHLIERQHAELCQRVESGGRTSPVYPMVDPEAAARAADMAKEVALPGPQESKSSVYHKTKVFSAASVATKKKTPGEPNPKAPLKAPSRSSTQFTMPPDADCLERAKYRITWAIAHPLFDCIMGLVILVNVLCVFIQFEWKGLHMAYILNLRDGDGGWPDAEKVFQYIEMFFCGIYALELLARLYLFRWKFLRSIGNIVDMIIVIISCIDSWILTPLTSGAGALPLARFVRLLRIARVLRAVKVLRFMSMFKELRVMLRSLTASIASLLWSMLFVCFIIIAGGVLMVQLTLSFVEDTSANFELRKWVYMQFGTAARSTWTIFEATFTTNWPTKARPLVMDVSPWFSIFWIFYTVVVNFAIMRVIAALFLKHTLAVSNIDEQRMSMEKMQQKEGFAEQLRQIFVRSDQLGDGVLHRWEFEAMVQDEQVMEMFAKLDLDQNEIMTLFEILSDRDGVADYEEFLAGALKMKNSTRTLDIVELMHEQMTIRRAVDALHTDVRKLFTSLLAAGVVTAGCDSLRSSQNCALPRGMPMDITGGQSCGAPAAPAEPDPSRAPAPREEAEAPRQMDPMEVQRHGFRRQSSQTGSHHSFRSSHSQHRPVSLAFGTQAFHQSMFAASPALTVESLTT